MFTHYYRYNTKYISEMISSDERLKIVYPTDEHAMITVGHDFYVIGTFQGIEVSERAELKAELIRFTTGEIVRTVYTKKKDNREGIYTDYHGIETRENRETVRICGMPDLVYDPQEPESFWYTWNKAYYTDQVFAVLICGGTCQLEKLYLYDQFGNKLMPIEEGYYELRISLDNGDETITAAKTLWFTEGKKEIILSRFSPETHVEQVKQFAEEEGFEKFTDPYAGIWDTQYFSIDWPVKAQVEIPARWHFGDAQEYESGIVHFFNYNISEACISWKTEIGTMLAKEKKCVDDPERLLTYFYKNGTPDSEEQDFTWKKLGIMQPGNYFQVTKMSFRKEDKDSVLIIKAICKPLPAGTKKITECAYAIQNRLAFFDYALFYKDSNQPFLVAEGKSTGVISEKQNAPDEFLILHAKHKLRVPEDCLRNKVRVQITARDLYGNIIEQQEHIAEIEKNRNNRVFD